MMIYQTQSQSYSLSTQVHQAALLQNVCNSARLVEAAELSNCPGRDKKHQHIYDEDLP